MASQLRDAPIGLRCVISAGSKCFPRQRLNRNVWFKGATLLLTFMAYTCYHMNRKPISVFKNVINRNCSNLVPPPGQDIDPTDDTWCDWAPFDHTGSDALLGTLDSSFLFAYAVAMFVSGFVAERVNLRYFLSFGMILSGIASYFFGLARVLNIHDYSYFVIVQVFGGIVQTTGWPGVVTVVGNWFGKNKRGFIFGVWNSHTSLGNILGTSLASHYVEYDWGLSFIMPGLVMAICGLIIFLFLAPHPKTVGCGRPTHIQEANESTGSINAPRRVRSQVSPPSEADTVDTNSSSIDDPDLNEDDSPESSRLLQPDGTSLAGDRGQNAIGFWGALQIPGVIEFSMSLFFSKLVSYTFLYWLPKYIQSTTGLSPKGSADFSNLFDFGGIIGGILAGVLSDYTGMSATTCSGMFVLTVPVLFVYQAYGTENTGTNVILLMLVGLLVNGPYALITTAVSAELGTHPALPEGSRAMATVTAIIDGTGSIGAAVGPFIAGFVAPYGWNNVFYILMAANILALLFLCRIVVAENQRFLRTRRGTWTA
ncbi:Glucose-6-phosphate exchanger SLC37A2 [Frankliniella fusca]|uniref:Sugar phosphate exchanger 3 n=1 Tax=Frankliniella fusca TaxID=407009 RepID=A0AAE1LN75_9NEOP|nr:Glucose-6-phosphate exchanger SLC37A2 [Frankliniella fusca]